ncbi:hypothetical protein [Peribacillus kribbensis]|uniref:hypothetical protein n=1 Tax=Peribacillus kribbensis TaxID=356658 RepID=UPI0003FB67AB|nr:hypothetical protein [Peribacillus kribbensis]
MYPYRDPHYPAVNEERFGFPLAGAFLGGLLGSALVSRPWFGYGYPGYGYPGFGYPAFGYPGFAPYYV